MHTAFLQSQNKSMGQVKALWGEKYLYTVKARVKSCMIKQVFNQKKQSHEKLEY